MKINKQLISKIFFVLILISSIATLFINKGLYYFELNNNIQVVLNGDQSSINNIFNNFSKDNLVRIDRLNNELFFENTSLNYISETINKLNSDNKVQVTITDNYYLRKEFINSVLLSIALIIVSTIFIYIYYILKNKRKLNAKHVGYLLLTYFVLTFFSNLFLAGIVSLLSRYYQVKEVDLIPFYILNLWISIIYFSAIWRLEEENFKTITEIYASEEFYHKKYIYLLVIILGILLLGLGANFVITALLILLSIVLTSFVYSNLGLILDFNLKNLSLTNLSTKNLKLRQRNRPTNTVTTQNPSKKKSKKKKNKNRKH